MFYESWYAPKLRIYNAGVNDNTSVQQRFAVKAFEGLACDVVSAEWSYTTVKNLQLDQQFRYFSGGAG